MTLDVDGIVDAVFARARCPRVAERHPKAKRPGWGGWTRALRAELRARGADGPTIETVEMAAMAYARVAPVSWSHPDFRLPRWPAWDKALRQALRGIVLPVLDPGGPGDRD